MGWEVQLAKLKAYKLKHGNCNVPKKWAEDPRLATWVSNQRSRKKNLDRGQPQPILETQVVQLEALGFEWRRLSGESGVLGQNRASIGTNAGQNALWEAQLAKLKTYKRKHGDCNVPRDAKLGNWVKAQRILKKQLDRGEPSAGMTAERAAKLGALGFTWDARIFAGISGTEKRRRLAKGESESSGASNSVDAQQQDEQQLGNLWAAVVEVMLCEAVAGEDVFLAPAQPGAAPPSELEPLPPLLQTHTIFALTAFDPPGAPEDHSNRTWSYSCRGAPCRSRH